MILVWMGCGDRCSDAAPPEGATGAHALAELIPADATAVAFSDDLGQLLEQVEEVAAIVPVDIAGPGTLEQWSAVGAKSDGPAALFWKDGQWVLLGWVDSEREPDLRQWSQEGSVQQRDVGGDDGAGILWTDDEDRWTQWMATDGGRIAAGWSIDQSADSLDGAIWTLEDDERWRVEERTRRWADAEHEDSAEGGDKRVHGAIDGERLIRMLPGDDHAGVVLRDLAGDVGQVYWSVPNAEDKRWTIELETPGGAEGGGTDLGEARGELPGLGGLIRRGSPGVLRLSAEPEQVMELFRENLDGPQQVQFDMMLEMLQKQLSVDLEQDVIGNITGQAAIVVLCFEDRFFELQGMERLAALMRLDATRGAVVVPFDDRESMKSVLNAFTQLTKGQLRRQATERTIQYARFDDGALKWAAILADEHLIFVDSAVAFDHVGNWESSPSPLDDIFVEHGVDSMLDGMRGMGAYVDVSTVRSLLREGGDDKMARWLEPLEAVRVTTDIDGQRERTDIDIWPTEQPFSGEE